MSAGLRKTTILAKSSLDWLADDGHDDRRDDEHRDDRGRRVGTARRVGGDEAGQPAEQSGDQQALDQEAGHGADLFAEAGDRIGGDQHPPDEQDDVRRELDGEQGGDQATDLGQGVIGPGQDAREVERQHAVALVPPEQLGRLGGTEQHDQDADDPVVARVADRRRVLDRASRRSRLRGECREADRQHGRQDGQAREDQRRDLGPAATTDPEARADALHEQRLDRAAASEPRSVVGLVAEVVDAAARAARAARRPAGRLRRRAAHDAPPPAGVVPV